MQLIISKAGSRACDGPLRHRRALLALLLAFGTSTGPFGPAEGRALRQHHRYLERESDERADVKKPAEGPLFAVVSIADQHVSFYDANGLWARSQVSTGVSGHPTPTGVFTILEKERWHRSNIYSGAPMPFMQRVTWTGVAMHAGVVPGHPASHGCIRLPAGFAKRLFAITTAGQRVVIAPEEVTPADIVHPHLPSPQFKMPALEAAAGKSAGSVNAAVETVALDAQPAASKPKALSPIALARVMKTAAAVKAASAVQAKKAAIALLEIKSVEARLPARELAAAEDAVRRIKGELGDAIRAAAKAEGEEAIKNVAERTAAIEARLAEAENKLGQARAAKAAKDEEVLAAERSIRDADAAAGDAAASAKEAVRRLEPVSVFISRKTGRLYVRQASEHLFDIPIAIRDPNRAIGTHLYIATRVEDGALRWVSLTPPAAVEVRVRPHSSRKGRKIYPEEDTNPIPSFPESASGALDRIEIPEEAAKRIAELLWTGATLIVSDVGMSGEGRFAMDFMILEHTRIREP